MFWKIIILYKLKIKTKTIAFVVFSTFKYYLQFIELLSFELIIYVNILKFELIFSLNIQTVMHILRFS